MGARGTIGVVDVDGAAVWLYTHWNGDALADVLQEALSRRERWDDASYLARIVFEVLLGNDRGGTTGFGIQAHPAPDANVEYLVADTRTQTVKMVPRRKPDAAPLQAWSFEDFATHGCPAFGEQTASP